MQRMGMANERDIGCVGLAGVEQGFQFAGWTVEKEGLDFVGQTFASELLCLQHGEPSARLSS
jgi:hypothetical protein